MAFNPPPELFNLTPELMAPPDLALAEAEAAQALRAAADLLATPHSWTQGCAARDARGNPVGPAAPTAVRWCLLGALDKHLINERPAASILAQRALAQVIAPERASAFNDGARYASEVVAVARAAAERLEAA